MQYDTILIMNNSKISEYILSQIQAGLTPEDITAQLRNAGWQETDIAAGFESARAQITPSPVEVSTVATPAQPGEQNIGSAEPVANEPVRQQLPAPIKRGRMKTGWLLFKQSFGIIKANPALWRYMVMSMLISLILISVMIATVILDLKVARLLATADSEGVLTLTPLGLVAFVLFGVAATSATFYYATALSSHVLSIFRGEQSNYMQHIKLVRSKLPAIITYAAISVVVGYLLRMLEQRFRFVGRLVSKFLGALWTLATSFVVSIIADSETSAPKAVKQSVSLFKQNWGETITGRVSLGGAVFLVYILIMLPVTFVLAVLLGGLFGGVGTIIAGLIFFSGVIVLGVVESLATNILNVCLYYYAKYGVVPPAFNPELLASVFVDKTKK